jgi:hypothetical protein
MCALCGWRSLVTAIEAHLERRVIDHTGIILATASDVIRANQHATVEQIEAVEQVLEERDGRLA